MKKLTAYLLLIALLLTGCVQKEAPAKTHIAAYENANALLSEGKYAEAAAIFESLNGYEESMLLCLYSRAKDKLQKSEYQEAFKGFVALGNYRDSALMRQYALACSYENKGVGNPHAYLLSVDVFENLGSFKDGSSRADNVLKSVYDEAERQLAQGNPAKAEKLFDMLAHPGESNWTSRRRTPYLDSEEMVLYAQIACLADKGGAANLVNAAVRFENMAPFRDAEARAQELREKVYQMGLSHMEQAQYSKAEEIFLLQNYKDSFSMAKYANASAIEKEAENTPEYYLDAEEAFINLGDFKDSAARAEATKEKLYLASVSVLDSGDYAYAKHLFSLSNYADSLNLWLYAGAMNDVLNARDDADRLLFAARNFESLADTRDSSAQALAIRDSIYEKAMTALKNGDYSLAEALFAKQNYKDSANMVSYTRAARVENGNTPEKYIEAARMYENMNGFSDSAQKAETLRKRVYTAATEALAADDFATSFAGDTVLRAVADIISATAPLCRLPLFF